MMSRCGVRGGLRYPAPLWRGLQSLLRRFLNLSTALRPHSNKTIEEQSSCWPWRACMAKSLHRESGAVQWGCGEDCGAHDVTAGVVDDAPTALAQRGRRAGLALTFEDLGGTLWCKDRASLSGAQVARFTEFPTPSPPALECSMSLMPQSRRKIDIRRSHSKWRASMTRRRLPEAQRCPAPRSQGRQNFQAGLFASLQRPTSLTPHPRKKIKIPPQYSRRWASKIRRRTAGAARCRAAVASSAVLSTTCSATR
ncbi:hypothetical protein IWX90DRAFT_264866 [Phyllosticta citrichinensis]|uniref:Uncharacterized protein n=1 Tax=Phyllosticta citrichinensis TaxID=1130410 RepID=A0ABR1XM86_9PEZI